MIFSIYITSNENAARHAFSFMQASLTQDHRIGKVFLQDRAVLLLKNSTEAADWSSLAQQHKFDIILCSNAAKAHAITEPHLLAGFQIDSLMQLLEAERDSDRLVTFRD